MPTEEEIDQLVDRETARKLAAHNRKLVEQLENEIAALHVRRDALLVEIGRDEVRSGEIK